MSNKNKVAVVGGAGHIGLPFSCFIASMGYEVMIIDNNVDALKKINNNEPPFLEEGLEDYIKNANKNNLTTDTNIKNVNNHKYLIVTLGTSSEQVEIDKFRELISELIEFASPDSFLILRSTVTINEINKINTDKLLNEKNIKLFYCPERIAEGKSLKEIKDLPQIIGSKDPDDASSIVKFFETLNIKTLVTSLENAAFLKLFTNAYRYAEFTLVNEFFNLAEKNNINFEEILKLACIDYPRLSSIPSYGFVGGPCLIKDTKTFIEQYSKDSDVLISLKETNDKFLNLIIEKCLTNFPSKKLIQIGLTFKPNSDDLRSSISLELYKRLKEKGFSIYPVDHHLIDKEIDFELFDYQEVKDETDNILISTYHEFVRDLNLMDKKVLTVGYK